MSNLKELQQDFWNTLTTDKDTLSSYIEDDTSLSSEKRIAIYANAYRTRLYEVLEQDHPCLGIYLGDELFDTMAKLYIQNYPSEFWSLRYYGDNLPELLEKFKPFKNYPVLGEIAEFERELLNCFDAKDSSVMTIENWQEIIKDESWVEKKIVFVDSLKIFWQKYNTVEIWKAIVKDEQDPPGLTNYEDEVAWLLYKQDLLTTYYSIEREEAQLIEEVIGKKLSFLDICSKLIEKYGAEHASHEAAELIKKWLGLGIISSLKA